MSSSVLLKDDEKNAHVEGHKNMGSRTQQISEMFFDSFCEGSNTVCIDLSGARSQGGSPAHEVATPLPGPKAGGPCGGTKRPWLELEPMF